MVVTRHCSLFGEFFVGLLDLAYLCMAPGGTGNCYTLANDYDDHDDDDVDVSFGGCCINKCS